MALSAAVLLVFVAHLRTLIDAEGERLPADVAFGSGVVIAVWLISAARWARSAAHSPSPTTP
jgi:hypothetical protein